MIRYYKCAVCGKRGMDTSNTQNKRFCSRECKNAFNRNDASCVYNEGVACNERKCKNCGWNPIVSSMRSEAMV